MEIQSGTADIDRKTYGIVACDMGNSRIKFFIGNKHHAFEYLEGWAGKACDFIISASSDNLLLGISSVNSIRKSDFLNELKTRANRNDIIIKNAEELLEIQQSISFKHLEGIGTDRVLGMYGAARLASLPLITADFGTAITINTIDKNGKCLGGAILPGIFTQMHSLAEKTEALPEIDLFFIDNSIGKNTEEEIRNGIILGTAGAVKEIAHRISMQEFPGQHVNIVIIGSSSVLMLKAFDKIGLKYISRPNLVIEGLFSLLVDVYGKGLI